MMSPYKNQVLPIIVIGAGISGISCAKYLQEHQQQVIVLEARDRIGGRIHSIHTENQVFDLGASWIHGIDHNPIWDIVKKSGIQTVIFNYNASVFLHENGLNFSQQEKDQFLLYVSQIEEKILSYDGVTALDAVKQLLDKLELNHSTLHTQLFSFFERIANDPFATDLSSLASDYQRYEGYFSGDEVIFSHGYIQVIHELAKELQIQLGVCVKEIVYAEDHVIVIDEQEKKYIASQVIVTVPLGVLKSKNITFSPELPCSYQHAIDTLGFGSFNKVFFQLDEHLEFIDKISESENSYFFWHRQCCFNILDMSQIYQKPTYLMLFGGEQSKFIDHKSDAEVWNFITQHLNAYLQDLISQPLTLCITRWGADPYSQGSFSFPAFGHSQALVQVLNVPIEKRIFLSGEHCHFQYAGTVHGAYLHGKEVANRLLEVIV